MIFHKQPDEAREKPDKYFSTEEYLNKKKAKTKLNTIIVFGALVVLTALQLFIQKMGVDLPIANNIAVLFLININVILLIVLALLVARNLSRLYLERRANVIGSKFQTKLVFSYIAIIIVPSVLLFMVASGLLTNSIDKWFDVKVETSLGESLDVAESYYKGSEENVLFYTKILSELVSGQKMLLPENKQYLDNTVREKRKEYGLDSIVVYAVAGDRASESREKDSEIIFDTEEMAMMIKGGLEGRSSTRILPFNDRNLVVAISPIYNYWGGTIIGATVASKYISTIMVAKINNIVSSFREYKHLKTVKGPIKVSYQITLLLITLLILFAAIWFGTKLARDITVPLKELVEATHVISTGNLDYQIQVWATDEIRMLVDSFNRMISDLKTSKQKIEAGNRELRVKNVELDRHSKYMETILENIATGVVSIDRHGKVTTINRAAAEILGLKGDDVKWMLYRNVFDAAYLNPMRTIIKEMSEANQENLEKQIKVTVGGKSVTLLVNVTVLRKQDGEYIGMVVVFDDLTELIKAQKTATWREVAQGIAHEIKNPLTPIKLNTQRLRKKFQEDSPDFDEVFDEATEVIIKEVEGLKRLVDEFSKFARTPEANPQPEDIQEIIGGVVALYRDNRKGAKVIMSVEPGIRKLNLDKEQIKRVFINLFENAVDAVDDEGGIIEVRANMDLEKKIVTVSVADNGAGINDEDREKLFLPYFSTKKTGTGLGLAITNRIITDHNGKVSVVDNQPRGAKFVIELPI
ncbi:MAG: ATP-binding protein [Nitrospinota bacterium]